MKKIVLSVLLVFLSVICLNACSAGNGGSSGGSSGSGVVPFSAGATVRTPTETETVALSDGSTITVAKNEVLVYAKEDITPQELVDLEAKINALGGTVVGSITETRLIQISLTSGASKSDFISSISTMPGVVSTGYNETVAYSKSKDNISGYKVWLNRVSSTVKSLIPVKKSAVSYPSFDGNYWIGQIRADEAWGVTTGSADTVIGIVDTGISKEQNVLDAGRITRFDQYGTSLDDDDSKDADTYANHGTWVTGFAAGFKDDADNQVRGVAWQNKVVMIDVGRVKTDCVVNVGGVKLFCTDNLFLTDVSKGINTAIDKGASVINISIGPTAGDVSSLMRFRKDMSSAVDYAKRTDRLLIFAAGNNSTKNEDTLLESGLETDSWLSHAMRVAATDSNKKDASFSNMGQAVDIAAPGSNIGFGAGTGSGTSFAAPLVTGTAGLVKSINPSLVPPEIRYLLLNSASSTVDTAYSPKILLDAFNTVNNANSTVGIPLDSTTAITLSNGEKKTVSIPVTVPATTVKSLDVLFLVDTTGSMGDDIDTFKTKAAEILNNLSSMGIDVQFGLASFADYPLDPFGVLSAGDKAFYLNQAITGDSASVVTAINNLTLHNGNDGPEAQLEALYQAATGAGINFADNSDLYVTPSSIGWRTSSLKIIIMSTDAPFHYPENEPTYPQGATFDNAKSALNNKGITVIGLDSGNTQGDLQKVVDATGGTLYQLSGDSAEIAQKIKDAMAAKLASISLTVQKISGDKWVSNITPASYTSVGPGVTKTFTVELTGLKNQGIEVLNYAVYLWVKGDSSAIIKRIKIPITVPSGK